MSSVVDSTNLLLATGTTYGQIQQYDWANDVEFQAGLSSILSSDQDPEQRLETVAKAKCFYFSRKFGVPVDYEAYSSWLSGQHQPISNHSQILESVSATTTATTNSNTAPAQGSQTTASSEPPPVSESSQTPPGQAPYPTSFAHIVELISTGQPIPGIKDIPNTILEGQSSQTSVGRRRKPWEKDDNTSGREASADITPSSVVAS